MKKYILKKDLPFAKAGIEIPIENLSLLIPFNDIHLCGAKRHFSYMVIAHEDDIPTLIKDGWIEEVKPREFYINKTKNGLLHAYYKENSALEGASLDDSETIKVVECI